jgi:Rab-GTPase-TBC domain
MVRYVLEKDQPNTQVYLKTFEHMCKRIPKSKKGYKYNKDHLRKFFIECTTTLFTGVFESEQLARILDRLLCVGEFVIISVMVLITEQLETVKMETLHYERAKVLIIQKAKDIDFMKLCFTLMNCNSDKQIFKEYLQERRVKEGLEIGFSQMMENR